MTKFWLPLFLIAVLLGGCASSGAPNGDDGGSDASAFNAQLGIEYLKQGNLQLAQEKLERARKQNPRDPNVHTGLALLYERLDDQKRAEDHYRQAASLAPRNPDIGNNYAVYLCKRGRHVEGVKRFESVASNPIYRTPEVALTNAGVCYRSAKRLPEAETSFVNALRRRPNYSEAAFQLGDMLLEQGRVPDARKHVDLYLGAFNPTPDLLLLGVRLARAAGDRVVEDRYARKLRVEFPNTPQTRALAEAQRAPR
jgi:type IV pilus assembly protein PilF